MLIIFQKIAISFVILFVVMITTKSISAAVITVTTNADTDDATCDSHCSLREAINAATSGDTIVFDREMRGTTIQLTRTLLIQKRLIIDGPNKRRITLKGNRTFRIIEIRGGFPSIDGLIISDGEEASGDGGGIYVNPNGGGSLDLTNCAILNNSAQRGGGIYMWGGGTLWVIDTTIAGNTAMAESGAGGIEVFRSNVRVINSTISGNRAVSSIEGTGGILLIGSPNWFISGSTIAYNSTAGSSSISSGGLAALNGIGGPLSNVVLAKNSGINPDFYGFSSGARNSFIGITNENSGFINGVNGNIVGSSRSPADPQLGVLTENGGGLPTHALMPASRAINTGNNALSLDRRGQTLAIDQRGYNRIVNSTVDIGSYEYDSHPALEKSLISGQIIGRNGRGVFGARVMLRAPNGETKFALTNPFGFYRFAEVESNLLYNIQIQGKRNLNVTQDVLIEELNEIINIRAN